MKERISVLLLSVLLLTAVGYVHVFQKIVEDKSFSYAAIEDTNEEAEENTEKSSEESSRETDQDEDPLKFHEVMTVSLISSVSISKIGHYSLGITGYYPEIVSPPPQS
jgi:uncharacterized ion transporter superfamily protein YfcC